MAKNDADNPVTEAVSLGAHVYDLDSFLLAYEKPYGEIETLLKKFREAIKSFDIEQEPLREQKAAMEQLVASAVPNRPHSHCRPFIIAEDLSGLEVVQEDNECVPLKAKKDHSMAIERILKRRELIASRSLASTSMAVLPARESLMRTWLQWKKLRRL